MCDDGKPKLRTGKLMRGSKANGAMVARPSDAAIARGSMRPFAMVANTVLTAAAWGLPMVPAVLINLEAASGQGPAWTAFALGSIGFAAACVEISIQAAEQRKLTRLALYGLLGALFLSLNIANALGNSARHSDDSREGRNAQIERRSQRSQALAQARKGREAQAAVAGEATPDSIASELESRKAAGARFWAATEGCRLEKITGPSQREFCAGLAALEAKRAAALKRDQLDARIAELGKDEGTAPGSADPFADSIGSLLSTVGIDVANPKIIAASRDWAKAIGVELLAAFGPAALLLLFAGRPERDRAPAPTSKLIQPQKRPMEVEAPEKPAVSDPLLLVDDPAMVAFIGRRLERSAGAATRAGELFDLWKLDCTENDIEPGSQKKFSERMQRHFTRDPASGRPKYLNVRPKASASQRSTKLQLAVSNC